MVFSSFFSLPMEWEEWLRCCLLPFFLFYPIFFPGFWNCCSDRGRLLEIDKSRFFSFNLFLWFSFLMGWEGRVRCFLLSFFSIVPRSFLNCCSSCGRLLEIGKLIFFFFNVLSSFFSLLREWEEWVRCCLLPFFHRTCFVFNCCSSRGRLFEVRK